MTAHVFYLPPTTAFLPALVRGVTARFDSSEILDAQIYLPTRRAATALRKAFLDVGERAEANKAVLMPRILPISESDAPAFFFADTPSIANAFAAIPPALSPVRRRLLLAKCIAARHDEKLPTHQALRLAEDFGQLIDQALIMGVDLANLGAYLPNASANLADHWQLAQKFIGLVAENWPKILQEEGRIDAVDRRQRLMRLRIDHWRQSPPVRPILAAGSTASQPVTAEFLAAISQMDKGAVILPGLDLNLDEVSWQDLDPTHPQYHMAQFLKKLDCGRDQVLPWHDTKFEKSRAVVLSEMMRPASTTDAWRFLKTEKEEVGLTGVQLIEARHEQEEATAAALIIRDALRNPEARVALVTPNRHLARRVAAIAVCWDIQLDDSGGRGLDSLPLGIYLRLFLGLLKPDIKPSDLMAFVKHPLAGFGFERGAFLRHMRGLEKDFFRENMCGNGLQNWLNALHETKLDEKYSQIFEKIVACVTACQFEGEKPLADTATLFLQQAELGLAQHASLWRGDEGEALATCLEDIMQNAHDISFSLNDSLVWFESALAQTQLRSPYGNHPRVAVLGLLEARLLDFDHVILAGLNEGMWPVTDQSDPWLPPAMRVASGLPLHDQYIGLMAHDFVQQFASPHVYLLRCERDGVAPSLPSRWLLRLNVVLQKLGDENALAPTQPWCHWAAALDCANIMQPCEPPNGSASIKDWPESMNVHDVELLATDPYAFYARKILKLEPCDALDRELDAKLKGTIMHKVLQDLIGAHEQGWPETVPQEFAEAMHRAYRQYGVAEEERALAARLWPKLGKAFYEFEKNRREIVAKTYCEIKAEWSLPIAGPALFLTARADRIDLLKDGTLAILDYKTGAAPTQKFVNAGFKPQLPLEQLLAEAGQFADVPQKNVSDLSYVKMNESSGDIKISTASKETDFIRLNLLADFLKFLAAFRGTEAVYPSVPRPQLVSPASDYARLARVGEWSKGALAQDEGEA